MPGPEIITTVLTPAASYDLTDLETVKDELSIPTSCVDKDAFLQRAISQISAEIAAYCERVFPVETVQDVIYPQRDCYSWQIPGGVAPLQLSRWPLTAVAWVKLTITNQQACDGEGTETTLIEGTNFASNAAKGQLIRLGTNTGYPRSWDAVPITVIYDAGYNPIPADLVGITLRLITGRFYARGRDWSIMQQDQPGLGSVRYWAGSMPGMQGPFPPDIAAALDNYRVPVIA